jgi:drug/metabolite transporter (DMT)-like permease
MEEISKNQHNAGRIMIISTALLWGLAGVCVKSIPWNSFSLMAVRSFIGLAMLIIYKRSFKVKITKLNVLGGLMMSLTGILYMASIKMTTAATAIVLQYVAPILVLLYTVVFQKKKPKPIEVILTLAVFGGCVLSFADKLDTSHIIGNLLGLLSGLTFAAQIILMNSPKADSEDGLYISNVMSFIFCLPFMFFDSHLQISGKIIIWVIILGVFQYGLANILFSKGIKLVDKVECSLLLTLEPIFNPIPVAIFCGEKMGGLAIAGFIVVVACVTLYGALPAIYSRKEIK